VREQAFTVLNRLVAPRMLEARGLLIESVSKGYQSRGFQLYQCLAGSALGETGDAYRCYLFSLFDEFALDLAVLFDRFSPQGRLFPRESALLALLDLINYAEIEPLWTEDETIGWIYQYFNSREERRKMRDESPAPRNSRSTFLFALSRIRVILPCWTRPVALCTSACMLSTSMRRFTTKPGTWKISLVQRASPAVRC